MTTILLIVWLAVSVIDMYLTSRIDGIEINPFMAPLIKKLGMGGALAANLVLSVAIPLILWSISPVAASIALAGGIVLRGYFGVYRNIKVLRGEY